MKQKVEEFIPICKKCMGEKQCAYLSFDNEYCEDLLNIIKKINKHLDKLSNEKPNGDKEKL